MPGEPAADDPPPTAQPRPAPSPAHGRGVAGSDRRTPEQQRADASDSLRAFGITVAGLVILVVFSWRRWALDEIPPTASWALLAFFVLLVLAAAGKRANGLWWGALVDNRNRVSLSRVQVITWTVVVVSAWFAVFLPRVSDADLHDAQRRAGDAADILSAQAAGRDDAARAAEIVACQDEFIAAYLEASRVDDLDDLGATEGETAEAAAEERCRTPEEQLAIEIAKCRETHVRDEQGIDDINLLQVSDREAAADARQTANEACEPDAASIAFPDELLLVMGISVASVTGSKLVKTRKRRTPLSLTRDDRRVAALEDERDAHQVVADEAKAALTEVEAKVEELDGAVRNARAAVEDAAAGSQEMADAERELEIQEGVLQQAMERQAERKKALDEANAAVEAQQQRIDAAKAERAHKRTTSAMGTLKTNEQAQDAQLTDMFLGDEVGDYDKVDASKVQMFLFTVVLVIAYMVLVIDLLQNENVLLDHFGVELPAFTASMVTLLAISHAGYIGVKSTDKTNERPADPE